ncbi:MAG TPA: hypothetical protein VL359_00965 [bacterium]|nr:hypothetical protein [bacterium]
MASAAPARKHLRRAIARLALAGALLAGGGGESAQAQFNGDFAIRQSRLNLDNFMDWRAYLPPPAWLLDAYWRPNVLQATVGSISQTRFYFSQSVRLEADLGRYATFLYDQEQTELFQPEPIYQEVELRLGVQPWYGSIIGFPTYDKALGNQGVAVAYGKRTDDTWLRLSQLEQQALYNDKHSSYGPERFLAYPILNRVEGRVFLGRRLFVQVDFRDEQPTRFDSPLLAMEQRYSGSKLDLATVWLAREDLTLGYTLSDNTERRQQLPYAPSAALPQMAQTLTWGWWEAYGSQRLAGGKVLTLAWNEARLRNGIQASDSTQDYLFHLDTSQVYSLLEIPVSAWFRWNFSLQYGQSTLLQRAGFAPDTPLHDAGDKFKFGAGIVLAEADRYRFWFNSTWAPDAISGQKWDGGNVQLQMFF